MCIRLRLPRKSMDAHRPPNGARARITSIGLPPTSAGANLIPGGPENSACVARKPSIAPPREAVLPHKVLGPRRATESLGFGHNAGIGPRHGRQAKETDRLSSTDVKLQEPPPAGRASPPEQAGGGNGWGCCEPRDPATGLYALYARVWLVQPAGCTPGVWRVAVYAVAAVQIEQGS